MNTIALSRTTFLRLKTLEKICRRSASRFDVDSSPSDNFLATWGGAFDLPALSALDDTRLAAIHDKHVK